MATCQFDIVPVDKKTGVTHPRHERPEGPVAFLDRPRQAVERMEQVQQDTEHARHSFLCEARNDVASDKERSESGLQVRFEVDQRNYER